MKSDRFTDILVKVRNSTATFVNKDTTSLFSLVKQFTIIAKASRTDQVDVQTCSSLCFTVVSQEWGDESCLQRD